MRRFQSVGALVIGVALALLPTTGVSLPFMSYGRSGLLVSFAVAAMAGPANAATPTDTYADAPAQPGTVRLMVVGDVVLAQSTGRRIRRSPRSFRPSGVSFSRTSLRLVTPKFLHSSKSSPVRRTSSPT